MIVLHSRNVWQLFHKKQKVYKKNSDEGIKLALWSVQFTPVANPDLERATQTLNNVQVHTEMQTAPPPR